MHKALFLSLALGLTNVALACGGKACDGCDKEHTAATVDVSKAEGTQLALAITGMHCGNCSSKITEALTKADGVNAASVDHESGLAQIAFDAEKTNAKALMKVVSSAGDFKVKVAEPKKEG